MVIVRRVLFLVTIFASLPISPLAAKELADYAVGDTIEADITTPAKLAVIDPVATEALKQQQADQVPVICRFYPSVAEEAEAALHLAFASARSNFLNAVMAKFGSGELLAKALGTEDFQQSVTAYQKQIPTFPLTAKLAGIWAGGESDAALQASLVKQLHAWTKLYIREDALPAGWKISSSVRIVPLPNREAVPTMETARAAGTIPRSSLRLLSRVRTSLEGSFSGDEQPFAGFTVGFLRANSVLDVVLSEQARAKVTDLIWKGESYEAGQVIAKRGEIVTPKILAALEQLQGKSAGEKLANSKVIVAVAEERNRWLIIALCGITVIAIAVIWKLRRRPQVTMLPARMGSMDALEVVAPAKEGSTDLRSLLAPHLARLLMNKFVRRLIVQRAEMISAQEKVAAEIAELEARLAEIHAPLKERLRAYESRIQELETQLSAKNAQNRELILAQIEGVKKRLETERAKGRMNFN